MGHLEGLLHWPKHWVALILSPALHLFGLVWLSPLPVQWTRSRSLLVRFLAALAFAEAYSLLWVLGVSWIRSIGGEWPPLFAFLGNVAVFLSPLMVAVGFLVDIRERLHDENLDIRAQAKETQAKVLQGQLHPHVLFNAMNGLAELIHRDPEAAEESVRHISALLRKVLDAAEQPAYTLGDERELLMDYLHMEGIRLRERLRLRWDWDERLDSLPLPPLLLQPLVENALKHGITPCEEG